MSLYLVLGGVRSGKSAFAERIASEYGTRGSHVCVAVFGNPRNDQEFSDRIVQHKKMRPEAFETKEAYFDPASALEVDDDTILVIDCLSTALSCFMDLNLSKDDLQKSFSTFVDGLIARKGTTIVVSSEVGLGFLPLDTSCRAFIDLLGSANQRIAQKSTRSWLIVAGKPLLLEDAPESLFEGL